MKNIPAVRKRKIFLNRAFTIIELLVVISVLSILIYIGTPRIKGMMDQSKKIQAQKELKVLQGAIESYYTFSNTKSYPPTSTSVGASYLITSIPKAISSVLYDPLNSTSSTEYGYKKTTNGKYWVAYSTGFNGTAGNISISASQWVSGLDQDDICVTNGKGCDSLTVCGNYQCPSNKVCCNQTCQIECLANGDYCYSDGLNCQSGMCDNLNLMCSAGIAGVSGCTFGGDCLSGYCDKTITTCSSGTTGVSACYDGSDCASGYCVDRVCSATKGTTGLSTCSDNTSCLSNYCSTFSGVCSAGVSAVDVCYYGRECSSGYCVDNLCSATKGTSGISGCNDGSSCLSGYCVHSVCLATPGVTDVDSCVDGPSCAGGYCFNGVCATTASPYGYPCYDGTNCTSGHCVAGYCAK